MAINAVHAKFTQFRTSARTNKRNLHNCAPRKLQLSNERDNYLGTSLSLHTRSCFVQKAIQVRLGERTARRTGERRQIDPSRHVRRPSQSLICSLCASQTNSLSRISRVVLRLLLPRIVRVASSWRLPTRLLDMVFLLYRTLAASDPRQRWTNHGFQLSASVCYLMNSLHLQMHTNVKSTVWSFCIILRSSCSDSFFPSALPVTQVSSNWRNANLTRYSDVHV